MIVTEIQITAPFEPAVGAAAACGAVDRQVRLCAPPGTAAGAPLRGHDSDPAPRASGNRCVKFAGAASGDRAGARWPGTTPFDRIPIGAGPDCIVCGTDWPHLSAAARATTAHRAR